jgi:hypothetical protein
MRRCVDKKKFGITIRSTLGCAPHGRGRPKYPTCRVSPSLSPSTLAIFAERH